MDEIKKYKVCSHCIMNSKNLKISFNLEGRCNFCIEAEKRISLEKSDLNLKKLIDKISSTSKGEYDCIIGLSGGLDSSYVAYLLRRVYGLNPLAIHLDNGWNSEIAVANIRNITKTLHIDLVTHVIEWDEFLNIQKSFLNSGIKNCEIPTDHAILAILYREAKKNGIKYIVHGGNAATEAIMPDEWMEDPRDYRLLKNIVKKRRTDRFKTFPVMKLSLLLRYILFDKIKFVGVLNYIDYNKKEVLRVLEKEIGYRQVAVKHGESNFTKFFQEIYLPNRFGIDKRLAHFSSEIVSKNMTRDEALQTISSSADFGFDMNPELEYVLDKLEISLTEWNELITQKEISYKKYRHTPFLHENRTGAIQLLRKFATAR
jgi:N-acetyl sugar amidotransferase